VIIQLLLEITIFLYVRLRLDFAPRAPVREHRRKFSVQTDNGLWRLDATIDGKCMLCCMNAWEFLFVAMEIGTAAVGRRTEGRGR
jgi:hypothetical protein